MVKVRSMLASKVLSASMALVLAAGLCPGLAIANEDGDNADIAVGTSTALAAATQARDTVPTMETQANKDMKQKGVKFDLKEGKPVKTVGYMNGAGKLPYTVKLNGLKVVDSNKKGYKEASFTVTFTLGKFLTAKQTQSVFKTWKKLHSKYPFYPESDVFERWISAQHYWFVTDYETGENLANPDNGAGVTVVNGDWSRSGAKKKHKSGDYWFTESKSSKLHITVTFPSDYENLCVGVGCGTAPEAKRTKDDASFLGDTYYLKGGNPSKTSSVKAYESTYLQTSFFKKSKGNFHFMRVS